MSDVEKVALWAGLISSIISIVMSLVAIVFAILVDRRARDVSDQTIRSLQKIESAVERLSSDTRELIKAGWDRMLGAVNREAPSGLQDMPAKELAAGIASELREELKSIAGAGKEVPSTEQSEKLEQVLRTLEATLAAQLRNQELPSRPSEALDQLVGTLARLSPEALALIACIRWRHLTVEQYQKLRRGPLRGAIAELRHKGMLLPFESAEEREPVYYFPARLARLLSAALPLVSSPPEGVALTVREHLRGLGYVSEPPSNA